MKFPTRDDLNRLLAVGGAVIILLQVAFITTSRLEVTVVLLGIVVNQVGVWGLASRLLPERRKYMLLRSEAKHLLGLVSQLNEYAVAGDRTKVEAIHRSMLESVDRMVPVAAVAERGANGESEAG